MDVACSRIKNLLLEWLAVVLGYRAVTDRYEIHNHSHHIYALLAVTRLTTSANE
ncbi:MAG TPA: hypothetical protein VNS88_09410 [Nitrospiraceae bacterium]|nr:hypothetical protein [Nitrospiraceae bacterium]